MPNSYFEFLSNLESKDVDSTIEKLFAETKKISGKFDIYEHPSPAKNPINWILFVRSEKYCSTYVNNYKLIVGEDKDSFPCFKVLMEKWHHYAKTSALLALEYMKFVESYMTAEQRSICVGLPKEVSEAMPLILDNSDASLGYAILKGSKHGKKRFLEGESAIFKSPTNTLKYITFLGYDTNKNIPEDILDKVEKSLSKDAECSLEYALTIKNKRFPLGEKAISKDAACSFAYAKQIICGRFEMGEKAISEREDLSLKYAVSVLGGELPYEMHKKMKLGSFAN